MLETGASLLYIAPYTLGIFCEIDMIYGNLYLFAFIFHNIHSLMITALFKICIVFNFRCSSTVGRSGGAQNVTLGAGCRQLGTILHEMMHCLGIVHEQSRPDRDNHVIVLKENIEKSKCLLSNFF